MECQAEQLSDGVSKLTLTGRMDSAGVQEVDGRFAALTATAKALVLVDLTQVSFLASIGIRTLVTSARALRKGGGRMALFGAQPLVDAVLRTAGIETIIPTYDDLSAALGALKGAEAS
jgi:anti-anti-sigma factor